MPYFWKVFRSGPKGWRSFNFATLQDLDTQNLPAGPITFNAVLSTCQKSGQWQRALSILSFLVTYNGTYDLISYNSAIACAEWEWAIQLLKDLQCNTLEANDVTCSAVISACGQSREWELGLFLLKESAQNRQLCVDFCENFAKWKANSSYFPIIKSKALHTIPYQEWWIGDVDYTKSVFRPKDLQYHHLQQCDQWLWESRAVAKSHPTTLGYRGDPQLLIQSHPLRVFLSGVCCVDSIGLRFKWASSEFQTFHSS